MILTRTKCRAEHPATLALGLNLKFILVGGAGLAVGAVLPLEVSGFLSPTWTAMAPSDRRSTAILAVLIVAASVGTAGADQAAPASTVGTFDFAYVSFALIWGAVFFAERPAYVALAWTALIVGAGVLAVRRP
ncbi:MAG: hypothetical protein AAFY65_04250 [Pseudomonadota bacterium]